VNTLIVGQNEWAGRKFKQGREGFLEGLKNKSRFKDADD